MRCKMQLIALLLATLMLNACVTLEKTWSSWTRPGPTPNQEYHGTCTSRAAFNAGRSDGRRGSMMRRDYAHSCLYNKARLNGAYRDGYRAGQNTSRVHPADRHGNLPSAHHAAPSQPRDSGSASRFQDRSRSSGGGMGSLFQDLRSKSKSKSKKSSSKPKASSSRGKGWRCVSAGGRKVCGYNCVTSGGKARCADTPTKRCVSSGTGGISCGYNCTRSIRGVKCASSPNQTCKADDFGNIKCE